MIVLASQSASRQAMLAAAGVPFVAVAAELDERALEAALGDAPAPDIVLALAEAKAAAVSPLHPRSLVLGSDSLVEVAGRRFAKPRDRAEAAEHLRYFSGRTMGLHSAAVIVADGAVAWRHAAVTSLQVIEMSDSFIEGYLACEWPEVSACVGVFRIEGRGAQLFERLDGDYFTVLGMPLLAVLGALRTLGVLPR